MMGSPGHPFYIHGTQFQVPSRVRDETYDNKLYQSTNHGKKESTVKMRSMKKHYK